MNRQKIGYRNLIVLGRNIRNGAQYKPEEILAFVHTIEEQLRWTPTEDFFCLFPPIKRYEDDGSWSYHGTLEMINREFGERFGKNDFLKLLMTHCYDNKFVRIVGIKFLLATSTIYRKRTGMSLAEQAIKQFQE
ncbi:hypothetical protein HNR63_001061 [Anoxybacillus kamchatkensis]|uniref:hypothetical protein n=1 Tax=Anoxybacillus ayderensis TaxID=265546 RepID=UPI0015EBB455|nr:hypothetical protein [Anoxybacillus ayderensis]MBA2878007.1 hypothetical protein [Anoxybacillus ayderensis]